MDIYLASTSPRRRQLLKEILSDFIRISPRTEEKEYPDLTPAQKAVRRSKDKCIAALNNVRDMQAVIISSDTIVDHNGKTLDKPVDKTAAFNMISALSGDSHYVHTAVSVCYDGSIYSFCDTTKVCFNTIPQQLIKEYVMTEIPYDKRGGYGIQTEYGSIFVKKIEGDFDTVVGLPVKRLKKLLKFLNIV